MKKNRYAATIAARRRIPPEVIAKVIQFSIGGPDGLMYKEQRNFFATIRSVCRLWHETSFSTPSLWRKVGLEIGRVLTENPLVDMRTYIWGTLTPWFLRAGEGAPVRLHLHAPVSTTPSDIFDFASETGFNLTWITFSGGGVDPTRVFSYSVATSFASSSSGPLPVKYLGVEFRHDPPFQPFLFECVIDLTRNFPELTKLSLAQAFPPPFRFPLKIVHTSLTFLHLAKLLLGSKEVYTILSGLPQLQTLHLEGCRGRVDRNAYTLYTHQSLNALIATNGIPEACLAGLTCPSLKSLIINGTPPHRTHRPNKGQILGQSIQRCGAVPHFYLEGGWPAEPLETILNSNTTLTTIGVDCFSSLCASPNEGVHRFINIPPSLSAIVIQQAATESQVTRFCDRVVLPDGQELLIHLQNCTPRDVAYFPWPRPGNRHDYRLYSMPDFERLGV
ncbi:hypothetical protein BKA70DRAFT_282981 [Coprinopsis sp. MPI-PUGE-AT-0042]|nr:hypothetical protein BKA70DRAFT_282981 [Coprinopsis sp. MPI-PUGE-AT-0042]